MQYQAPRSRGFFVRIVGSMKYGPSTDACHPGYFVFRKYATKKCSSAWIFMGTHDVLVSLKST